MTPLEAYVLGLRNIHSTGAAVPETSYYGQLEGLLNAIGATLRPRVRCVINPRSQGAGIPDGGLYTPDQLPDRAATEPLADLTPARGVIAVKSTADDVTVVANSDQVRRYLRRYGQVLVTNYRDFLLVTRDRLGNPVHLEGYRLAPNESAFWVASANPAAIAAQHGNRLEEYLKRVMLRPAPLATPKDLAWFLASYAREALARIDGSDHPSLSNVRRAMEDALGITFEGAKGDHFFRSTLIQTLFYGVFSAWVLWSRERPAGSADASFDWRIAAWSLRVPILRKLFHELTEPGQMDALGLVEVLDWAGTALDRVDREAFFQRFEQKHAVQYFYEPFLQAFDPILRKELGVWYTPPEIVKYMVARVDTVLRTELGIEDGLADPRVYVLDPCCGTGTYLLEVLERIHETACLRSGSALAGHDTKQAATERVFGFEILPAPFVVAHLQLGLLLQRLSAPLSPDGRERAGVYLTNALTGWDPLDTPRRQLSFREMEEERDAAERVKRHDKILVVIGNPPYNAFAGVSPQQEQGLVEPYKDGLASEWGIRKFNLDDLYVRFFRLAERRIAEMTGRGVVCYISNHSWVSDPSFVVMRRHLLDSFDRVWVENMHGNRKISEYAPDGRTSETMFAIPGFSVGIQQGVAISLWVRRGDRGGPPIIRFRDDLDAAKATDRRAHLLASLDARDFDGQYEQVHPLRENRFAFRPVQATAEYLRWPRLTDLCAVGPYQGLSEDRRKALIDISDEALASRVRRYLDPSVTWAELKSSGAPLTDDYVDFPAEQVRASALERERFDRARIHRYAMRPFDVQYCYFTSLRPIWRRHRPEFHAQAWAGNRFVASRFNRSKDPEGTPFAYLTGLCDYHFLTPNVAAIPLLLRNGARLRQREHSTLLDLLGDAVPEDRSAANLSRGARAYLADLGIAEPDADEETAGLIWMHALAVGYAPAYLHENADGVGQDWPRVPLPATEGALRASAALGRRVAALLDVDVPVPGVTQGRIRAGLATIAVVSRVGGGALQVDGDDLALTAGWGHAGKDGVVMPAKGRCPNREYSAHELAAIGGATAALGDETADVYLNGVAYWANVPRRVWEYTIGGYQVVKKWLSYRERTLLGRPLAVAEARSVSDIARRIAALLLVQDELDANYRSARDHGAAFAATEDRR